MAKADTDYRPRLEQLTQPDIDAHEVLDKLDELNDRSTPTRQGYLFSIAGKKARLFDLNNTEILVRAEQVEHYLDKGFTVKSQAKTEDGGTSRLHDVVPVLTQVGTEPVIRQVEEQKEADAAAEEAKFQAAVKKKEAADKKKADEEKAKAEAEEKAKTEADKTIAANTTPTPFTSIDSAPPAGKSKP